MKGVLTFIQIGRHTHTLLELFKYITENPEPSERLLEKLRMSRPSKPQLVEGLVF
jgi:hypothetical protein